MSSHDKRRNNYPNGFVEDLKSINKSNTKSISKSSDKSGNKLNDKSINKPNDKSGNKSSDKLGNKSGDKLGNKSGDKLGNKLDEGSVITDLSTWSSKVSRMDFDPIGRSVDKMGGSSEISGLESVQGLEINTSKRVDKNLDKDNKVYGFNPVSVILSLQNNHQLTEENSYIIKFNIGILEGHGIEINDIGTIITFRDAGSYRFEIQGEAIMNSDVEVNLIYEGNNFTSDILHFCTTKVPKIGNKLQLRGLATMLPIQKNQKIVAKLIPSQKDSIIVMEGTRLLIHRVA